MNSSHLDTPEAAHYLRLCPGTLEVWRCMGRGPRFRRVGRRIFYTKEDLDEFAKSFIVETVDSFPVRHKD